MKELIKQVIDFLRAEVNSNLSKIRQNEKKIKELIKQPLSSQRTTNLEETYNINKVLLESNKEAINLQMNLINYLNKQRASLKVLDTTSNFYSDPDIDYFELTVNGCLPFDEEHPLYDNSDFFEQLFKHYQDVENYEMCGILLKQKRTVK